MNYNNFYKQELEIIISIYEAFFAKIFEFDTKDQLADYISERINHFDQQLIELIKQDK